MSEQSRKLVIFGGGSAYTPEVFDEIIKRNRKLNFNRITLVDIPEGMKCANIILAFGKRMFQKAGIIPLTGNVWGKAEQVADAVIFLAGDGASHITGTVLYVDGGSSLIM